MAAMMAASLPFGAAAAAGFLAGFFGSGSWMRWANLAETFELMFVQIIWIIRKMNVIPIPAISRITPLFTKAKSFGFMQTPIRLAENVDTTADKMHGIIKNNIMPLLFFSILFGRNSSRMEYFLHSHCFYFQNAFAFMGKHIILRSNILYFDENGGWKTARYA